MVLQQNYFLNLDLLIVNAKSAKQFLLTLDLRRYILENFIQMVNLLNIGQTHFIKTAKNRKEKL